MDRNGAFTTFALGHRLKHYRIIIVEQPLAQGLHFIVHLYSPLLNRNSWGVFHSTYTGKRLRFSIYSVFNPELLFISGLAYRKLVK